MSGCRAGRVPIHRSVFAVGMLIFVTWPATSSSQEPRAIRLADGYLFIDGRYIEPPYDIELKDDSVWVNGQQLTEEYLAPVEVLANAEFGHNRMGRRKEWGDGDRRELDRGDGDRRGAGSRNARASDPLGKLLRQLEIVQFGATAVLFRQQQPLVLFANSGGYQLVNTLAGHRDTEAEEPLSMSPAEHAIWDRLVREFEPSAPFVARVSADTDAFEQAAMEGERSVAANQLLSRISYPLTVFAMIAIAIAVGHLMSNRPFHDGQPSDLTINQKYIIKTLSMIAVFSLIDLAWTIASSNAGIMRELNPLGSQLVRDPKLLTVFKLTLTSMSVGILYAQRNHRFAQTASWWCCLLLMLLTSRWVMFQSLFS